jgi:hypothetical protein
VAETIAALWAQVLGVERIGASDNFFDLGGHSLQLIRVHGLLEARLGRGCPWSISSSTPRCRPWRDASSRAQIARAGATGAAQAAAARDGMDAAQRRREALLQRKRHIERTL